MFQEESYFRDLRKNITDQDELGNMQEIGHSLHTIEQQFYEEEEGDLKECEDDEYLLNLMRAYDERDKAETDVNLKDSGTLDLYIQKLRRTGFPWLKAKYGKVPKDVSIKCHLLRYRGLNMKYLVDFGEKCEKPCFAGKEGFYQRHPNAAFRLSESDIRSCVHVS